MMRNSHSDTLFHYTKQLSSLISILKEGFRVSYSGEQITDKIFIGIPMVSFCDIPVDLSGEHRSKYGEYAIGIDKQKLIKAAGEHLSPVHYVIDDWPILGAYRHHEEFLKAVRKRDDFMERKRASGAKEITIIGHKGTIYKGYAGGSSPEDYEILKCMNVLFHSQQYANYALGITKNYTCRHDGKNFCAYDECEWRIVIPENQDIEGNEAKWFWSKDEFDEWKKEHGNTFLDGCLIGFEPDYINAVIVPTEQDKADLVTAMKAEGLSLHPDKIIVTNG